MANAPATPTSQPNAAQRTHSAVTGTGATLAERAGNIFTGVTDWAKNKTGWEWAGIAAGGLLAWVIGNAFGGGGILGMIISAMLIVPMAIGGSNMFNSFGSGAQSASQSNQRQPQRSASPDQHRGQRYERTRVSELSDGIQLQQGNISPAALAQAREVAFEPVTNSAEAAVLPARPVEPRAIG